MCGPGRNVGVTENRERGTGKMVSSFTLKYRNDPVFREKQKKRNRKYANSEHGKAKRIQAAVAYQNSEHGFITVAICAVFKPSSCRRRGLWPAMTKKDLWEEFEKHVSEMKQKFPESDGRLCIYCENPWTYKRTYGTEKRVKFQTNFSIDRIDNNKTYQIGNIGFCCSGCNDKKHHATLELMENVIKVAKEKGLR